MNFSIPTLFSSFFFFLLLPPLISPLSQSHSFIISQHQLTSFSHPKPHQNFQNSIPSLQNSLIAFQAFKNAIFLDPNNFTGNWIGPNVCSYNGIFCSPSPDDPNIDVVSAIDLNGANITGFLPKELSLLTNATIFHANSNNLGGTIPDSFSNLERIVEFDVSNNQLDGGFPMVVLKMPSLKYLDLRFNDFEGPVPAQLFEKELDALFLNNNRFGSSLPDNIGDSTLSIVVLAGNKLSGCIPRSIGRMRNINEIIVRDNELCGCLPVEVGLLRNLTVFDVGKNSITGILPESFGMLINIEELDVSHNMLSGVIPKEICELKKLDRFSFSDNYFDDASVECGSPSEGLGRMFEYGSNCLSMWEKQRDESVCSEVTSQPVNCQKFKCGYN